MNNSIQCFIQCPFFLSEKNNLLCCEGYIDSTCMTTRFPSRDAKTAYIKENCFKMDGGGCYMAKELFDKYRRLEAEENRNKSRQLQRKLTAKTG